MPFRISSIGSFLSRLIRKFTPKGARFNHTATASNPIDRKDSMSASDQENSSRPVEPDDNISELRRMIRQVEDAICRGPDSVREHLRKIEEALAHTATRADLDNVELNISKGAHKTLRRVIIFMVLGTIVIIALLIVLLGMFIIANFDPSTLNRY